MSNRSETLPHVRGCRDTEVSRRIILLREDILRNQIEITIGRLKRRLFDIDPADDPDGNIWRQLEYDLARLRCAQVIMRERYFIRP